MMTTLTTGTSSSWSETWATNGTAATTTSAITTDLAVTDDHEYEPNVFLHVLKSLVLISIIVLAIFSNLLVVVSVVRYHKLRHINNYFLVSLAFADLLVACFAMTFNATVEITGSWKFGYHICDMWNSLDVHFSTVSTLHLCCISVDRYYAIVKPLKYTSHMTVKVASMMIGIAWIAPTLISFLPIFMGWYTTSEHQQWRQKHPDECIFRVNKPYALLSSTLTFWAPVVVMLCMYHRIYKEALRQKEAIRRSSVPSQQHLIVDSETVRQRFQALQANGFKSNTEDNNNSGNRLVVPNRSLSVTNNEDNNEVRSAETAFGNNNTAQLAIPGNEGRRRVSMATSSTASEAATGETEGDGVAQSSAGAAAVIGVWTLGLGLLGDREEDGEPEKSRAWVLRRLLGNRSACSSVQIRVSSATPNELSDEEEEDNEEGQERQRTMSLAPSSHLALFQSHYRQQEEKQRSPSIVQNLGSHFSGQWLRERHRIHTSWRKEHKAFVTLGIVMGAFLLCWLPFFTWYLTANICGPTHCPCPDYVVTILFWIGYFNSTLNPVIYVMTNRDFKDAFTDILRKIFCFCCDNKDDFGLGASSNNNNNNFGTNYNSNVDFV